MATLGFVHMDDAQIDAIMQYPQVRQVLHQVAERVADNARVIAAEAGMPRLPITVESGTRPKGRSYSRVVAPLDPKFGSSRSMTRNEILAAAVDRL